MLLPQIDSFSVPINRLASQPYINLICYPTAEKAEAEKRIEELKKLGVKSIVFEGRTKIGNLHLLGKGCVGLVVKAELSTGFVALKMRRTDANRLTMYREADLQRLANKINVGPRIVKSSDNFLLMDLVIGVSINEWIRGLKGRGSTSFLRKNVKEVLDQSFRLDTAGIDHGELSNLEKHVYVGEKVCIIDFETASLNRRVANVTSSLQNLFIGGPNARKVCRMLRIKDKESVITSARYYKENPCKTTFESLITNLKLI